VVWKNPLAGPPLRGAPKELLHSITTHWSPRRLLLSLCKRATSDETLQASTAEFEMDLELEGRHLEASGERNTIDCAAQPIY
jgi:hypothetical protein